MSDFVKYEIDNKGICIFYINRPPVNALSFDLLQSIYNSFIEFTLQYIN